MLRVIVATAAIGLAGVTAGAAPGVEAASDPPPPPVTVNEFIPEDRDLSDCLSSLPKPGCGSEARGGWRQGLVFGAVVAGVGVVAWRISVGVRRNRRSVDPTADVSRVD